MVVVVIIIIIIIIFRNKKEGMSNLTDDVISYNNESISGGQDGMFILGEDINMYIADDTLTEDDIFTEEEGEDEFEEEEIYASEEEEEIDGCFPLTSYVRLDDGKKKNIKHLKVGDVVKIVDKNDITTSKITSFIHKHPSEETTVIKLYLSNGNRCTATYNHLIDINGSYIPISKVMVGDKVSVLNKNKIEKVYVDEIKIGKTIGYAAPMTENGTIIVDDVLFSCFANTSNIDVGKHHTVAQLLMTPMKSQYVNKFDFLNSGDIHWFPRFLSSF